jgi:hemerythrin
MQWTEDLTVGVEAIDNQHKELFSRINSLADAIRQGKCTYIIHGVVTFLERLCCITFQRGRSVHAASRLPGIPTAQAAASPVSNMSSQSSALPRCSL